MVIYGRVYPGSFNGYTLVAYGNGGLLKSMSIGSSFRVCFSLGPDTASISCPISVSKALIPAVVQKLPNRLFTACCKSDRVNFFAGRRKLEFVDGPLALL